MRKLAAILVATTAILNTHIPLKDQITCYEKRTYKGRLNINPAFNGRCRKKKSNTLHRSRMLKRKHAKK